MHRIKSGLGRPGLRVLRLLRWLLLFPRLLLRCLLLRRLLLYAGTVGSGRCRSRSRSCMNSSYFAVPGRGGASDGRPPAHAGMESAMPADIFSLIVPQPDSAPSKSAAASSIASWRRRAVMGEVAKPCLIGRVIPPS